MVRGTDDQGHDQVSVITNNRLSTVALGSVN